MPEFYIIHWVLCITVQSKGIYIAKYFLLNIYYLKMQCICILSTKDSKQLAKNQSKQLISFKYTRCNTIFAGQVRGVKHYLKTFLDTFNRFLRLLKICILQIAQAKYFVISPNT